MKKTKVRPPDPKKRLRIAIIVGIVIVVGVIGFSYNLDQAKLSGQRFGDDLSLIQSDLSNETSNYYEKVSMYEKGQIPRDQILNITDQHLASMRNLLTKYDSLNPPQPFIASLRLFRLSTETQIDSDKLLKEWIQTGDNSTKAKSDQLLQESFQYEMNALHSYNNAKASNSK
ncbi:MAG: hypothetical protein KGI33_01175 [Thaumarchaeota archaeon]|nr:hypothetical protein [Nitrososphaerota archaeon]